MACLQFFAKCRCNSLLLCASLCGTLSKVSLTLCSTGQRKFLEFCRQAGKLHSSGSPCPADEWTLCLFVPFLADSIQHSSIKVYLSAVRSLHIEQGFPDPLLNCLRLQRVLRGVKRSQGSPASQRLPITHSLLLVIHRALDLKIFDHCAFWAACLLGYFGFLCSAEFTVPNLATMGDKSVETLCHFRVLKANFPTQLYDCTPFPPNNVGFHVSRTCFFVDNIEKGEGVRLSM